MTTGRMKRNLLAILFAITAMFGCGGGSSNGGGPPPPPNPSCTISASPNPITAGQSSTLSWSSSNATSASIDQGIGSVTPNATGSQTVTPAVTTKYTMTVTGNGKSATCDATLKVNVTVSVSPTSVTLNTGATQQFTATVTGTSDTRVTWSVPGGAANGTIDASGLYTAPATAPNPATVSVVATSVADSTKSASASVTITWHIGGGAFTGLAFTESIPAADQAFITDYFNLTYPVAIKVLGLPPDVSTLTVTLGGWGYNANTHTLNIATLPTQLDKGQIEGWKYNYLHEFSHGMTLSQYTGVGPDWIAEAYADAGARLIYRLTSDAKQFVNEQDYDVLQLGGKEYVGGINGKSWRGGNPDPTYVNEESGVELLQFLNGTQSSAQVGDWQNYATLKTIKAGMYDIANQKQQYLTESDFMTVLGQFSQPIEGLNPDQWAEAQAVAYTYGQPGVYLYVHVSPVATANYGAGNDQWLEIGCLQRLDQEVQPGIPKEIACTSGLVTVTVSNSSGTVTTISNFDLSSASHELTFDVSHYAFGNYRVQASGTANGVTVVAPDSYFGVYDPSVAPSGWEIGVLPSVMFLLVKNADGTPSSQPVPAPTGGPSGYFIGPNKNGAAIWQVDTTKATTIPQPEYDWLGRRLPVPLPLSPTYLGSY
jgi:hypothetical protein